MLLIGDQVWNWNMRNYIECLFMFSFSGSYPGHGAISSCVWMGWHLVMLISPCPGGYGGQHWGENVWFFQVNTRKSFAEICLKYVCNVIFYHEGTENIEHVFVLPCMCPASQVLDSICRRDFYNIHFVRVHVWSLQGMWLLVFIDPSQFLLVCYFVLRNSQRCLLLWRLTTDFLQGVAHLYKPASPYPIETALLSFLLAAGTYTVAKIFTQVAKLSPHKNLSLSSYAYCEFVCVC